MTKTTTKQSQSLPLCSSLTFCSSLSISLFPSLCNLIFPSSLSLPLPLLAFSATLLPFRLLIACWLNRSQFPLPLSLSLFLRAFVRKSVCPSVPPFPLCLFDLAMCSHCIFVVSVAMFRTDTSSQSSHFLPPLLLLLLHWVLSSFVACSGVDRAACNVQRATISERGTGVQCSAPRRRFQLHMHFWPAAAAGILCNFLFAFILKWASTLPYLCLLRKYPVTLSTTQMGRLAGRA